MRSMSDDGEEEGEEEEEEGSIRSEDEWINVDSMNWMGTPWNVVHNGYCYWWRRTPLQDQQISFNLGSERLYPEYQSSPKAHLMTHSSSQPIHLDGIHSLPLPTLILHYSFEIEFHHLPLNFGSSGRLCMILYLRTTSLVLNGTKGFDEKGTALRW